MKVDGVEDRNSLLAGARSGQTMGFESAWAVLGSVNRSANQAPTNEGKTREPDRWRSNRQPGWFQAMALSSSSELGSI